MTLPMMSFIFGALLLAVGILGGGFEVKEVKVSNVTTTGRILAGLFGAAFIVLGFWHSSLPTTSEPTPLAPLPAASTAARMSEREHDKNRFGGDYSTFDVATDRIEDCEGKCKEAQQCAAWTYVKPGFSRPNAVCWLKDVAPAISDNVCCVSGTKIR